MAEQLYQCPLCKRSGFSFKGLHRHFCPEKKDAAGRSQRLLPREIASAIALSEQPVETKQFVIRRTTLASVNTWLTVRTGWTTDLQKAQKFTSVEAAQQCLRGRRGVIDEFVS